MSGRGRLGLGKGRAGNASLQGLQQPLCPPHSDTDSYSDTDTGTDAPSLVGSSGAGAGPPRRRSSTHSVGSSLSLHSSGLWEQGTLVALRQGCCCKRWTRRWAALSTDRGCLEFSSRKGVEKDFLFVDLVGAIPVFGEEDTFALQYRDDEGEYKNLLVKTYSPEARELWIRALISVANPIRAPESSSTSAWQRGGQVDFSRVSNRMSVNGGSRTAAVSSTSSSYSSSIAGGGGFSSTSSSYLASMANKLGSSSKGSRTSALVPTTNISSAITAGGPGSGGGGASSYTSNASSLSPSVLSPRGSHIPVASRISSLSPEDSQYVLQRCKDILYHGKGVLVDSAPHELYIVELRERLEAQIGLWPEDIFGDFMSFLRDRPEFAINRLNGRIRLVDLGFVDGSEDGGSTLEENIDSFTCVAKYSYRAHTHEEISFLEGDEIEVLRQHTGKDGWWSGRVVASKRTHKIPSPSPIGLFPKVCMQQRS